jgi:hypothetical protein
VCIVVIIGVLYQPRRLLGLSALATGLLALGSIPDYSRSVGLGIAETVVAALLAIVTAAATTGRYRLATVPPGPADRRSDGSGVPSEPTDGPTSQGPPRMLPPPQR